MTPFQQFMRPRYFTGQILGVEDLRCEQDYLRGKARLQHRFLHGWGIVAGLEVCLEAGETLRVNPGFALDCAGNELLLPEPQRLSLAGMSARCHLTLRYAEIELAPTPTPDGPVECSRVRETVQLELVGAHPGAGHSGMGPGSPGCGQAHALSLATLTPHAGGWRLRVARCRLRPGR